MIKIDRRGRDKLGYVKSWEAFYGGIWTASDSWNRLINRINQNLRNSLGWVAEAQEGLAWIVEWCEG